MENGFIILELFKISECLPAIIYLVIKSWPHRVTLNCVPRNKDKLVNALSVFKTDLWIQHPIPVRHSQKSQPLRQGTVTPTPIKGVTTQLD